MLDWEEKTDLVCLRGATPDISPNKEYAGRCVHLDLSFGPELRREPTAVLNCKWTSISVSVGSAVEATERLVNSGGL